MIKPRFYHALFCITILFSILFLGLFIFNINMHSLMLIAIGWMIINCYGLDSNMERLKTSLKSTIQHSAGVFLIFILIGAVIAAFIISGAVPTLIYYGLSLISPQAFLPMAMLLCGITSLTIGTCWGTIGTMGVALFALAAVLHIPLPIAAGAIISGAYFGDKVSPLSDTTILSAHAADVDIYEHIKKLSLSLIPAFLISLLLFTLLGWDLNSLQLSDLNQHVRLQQEIKTHFNISFWSLLPMVVMFGFSFKKKPAEISMLASMACAVIIAVIVQHHGMSASINSLFSGPTIPPTNSPVLNTLLHHGGIKSMVDSMALTLLILALGGLLESYYFVDVLFAPLIQRTKKPLSLLSTTLITCIVSNMLLGEAYLSILLMGKAYTKTYHDRGLKPYMLSNALEEGCTFSTPLIPWTTSGIFIGATLGISPTQFIFWSLFNWIAPFIFLLMTLYQITSKQRSYERSREATNVGNIPLRNNPAYAQERVKNAHNF